jgi:hypothetical protein
MPRTKEVFTIYPRKLKNGKTVYYIARCNTMGKKSISREHAHIERGYLENHIRPWFGKKAPTSITTKDVEEFVIDLLG